MSGGDRAVLAAAVAGGAALGGAAVRPTPFMQSLNDQLNVYWNPVLGCSIFLLVGAGMAVRLRRQRGCSGAGRWRLRSTKGSAGCLQRRWAGDPAERLAAARGTGSGRRGGSDKRSAKQIRTHLASFAPILLSAPAACCWLCLHRVLLRAQHRSRLKSTAQVG